MYKLLICLLLTTSLSASNLSEPTLELTTIEHLIQMTKVSVQIQEKIRLDLIAYQKINKAFLQNPKDKELLFQNIKSADRLFQNIKNAHLTHNFSSEFLKELALFSNLASKQGVPN